MRKWTYQYLEVLAEQVLKRNEIFRSHDRAEMVRKVELPDHCLSFYFSDLWQSRQSRSAEAEEERDLSKSWPSRSTESGISWQ